MKETAILAVAVVVAMVAAGGAIGMNLMKNDEITTEVLMDDGMTCTINGTEVANGDTVTLSLAGGVMSVHIDSQILGKIAVCGLWASDSASTSVLKGTDSAATAADIPVRFVRHGTYRGAMYISNDAADGNLAPIILKFTIDESMVTVNNGGTVIHNNDVVTFTNDTELQVTTVDGKSHEITFKGTWSNSSGMSSGASGSELGTSTTIYIVDTMYFDAGNGTMEVGVKNE